MSGSLSGYIVVRDHSVLAEKVLPLGQLLRRRSQLLQALHEL